MGHFLGQALPKLTAILASKAIGSQRIGQRAGTDVGKVGAEASLGRRAVLGSGDGMGWEPVGGRALLPREGSLWEAGLLALTGENVLVAVFALVLRPLAFQALVQILYLLLLQTLKCERTEPPCPRAHPQRHRKRADDPIYPSPAVPSTHLKFLPEAGLGGVLRLLLLVEFQDPVLNVCCIYPSGIVRLG